MSDILLSSLPLRDLYNPSALSIVFYMFPIFLGFAIERLTRRFDKSLFILLAFSFSFVFFIGGSPLQAFSYAYYCIFFICLGALGVFLSVLLRSKLSAVVISDSKVHRKDSSVYLISSLLVIVALSSINLIYIANSNYPVGADVYFHAAVSDTSTSDLPFSNPYFKEGSIYPYSPQGYALPKALSLISGLDLIFLWRMVPFFGMLLCLFSIFILVRYMYGDRVAFFSILFIAPLNQFIFYDASIRIFAYFLLIISAWCFAIFQTKRHRAALFSALFLGIFLIFFHLELFVHWLIFAIVFGILNYRSFRINSGDIELRYVDYFLVGFAGLSISVLGALFAVSPTSSSIIYNEIFVSLIYPIGVISVICFVLCLVFMLSFDGEDYRSNLLLAILFLCSNSLFYFTGFWLIHHRYFNETGYIAAGIMAAVVLVTILRRFSLSKTFTIISIVLLLFASFYARFDFASGYSKNVSGFVSSKAETLTFLKTLSPANISSRPVVLAPPEDFINRYIPLYSGLFIFAGQSSNGVKVLPLCGDYSRANSDCAVRVELANKYLGDPSKQNYDILTDSRELDYVALPLRSPYLKKFNSSFATQIHSNSEYAIFEVSYE